MKKHLVTIRENKQIAVGTYEMILDAPTVEHVDSGQFIHMKLLQENHILRRPFSVAHFAKGELTILYKVVGQGTDEMTTYKVGQELDILAPLGHGFETEWIEPKDNVVLVGGGIGIAPLYQLACEISEKVLNLTIVLGFTHTSEAYYVDEFKRLGHVIVTTMDGELGMHGHVGVALDVLQTSVQGVYACGPLPLLIHVQQRFSELEHTYLSLEERMACGMGGCHGCDTKDKKYRVCYDGPVFKAQEVEL